MTTSQVTEELIKQTAKELFFSKGMINATTQEIADAAGINRALIHYYFRSRDRLFDLVLSETSREIHDKSMAIFFMDIPLKEKVSKFLEFFMSKNINYPYLPIFVVTSINQHPDRMKFLFDGANQRLAKAVAKDMERAIMNKELDPITPEHFIANIMSLANYPSVAKPILKTTFGYDEDTYAEFLKERKKIILQTIFKDTRSSVTPGEAFG